MGGCELEPYVGCGPYLEKKEEEMLLSDLSRMVTMSHVAPRSTTHMAAEEMKFSC